MVPKMCGEQRKTQNRGYDKRCPVSASNKNPLVSVSLFVCNIF
jgi:hypothetical protein